MTDPAVLAIASAFCLALSSLFIGELRGRLSLLQLARWQLLATLAMTAAAVLALRG